MAKHIDHCSRGKTAKLKSKSKSFLQTVLRNSIDVTFPAVCEICKTSTRDQDGDSICERCLRDLIVACNPCPRCAYPAHVRPGLKSADEMEMMTADEFRKLGCMQCFQMQLHFRRTISLGAYRGLLRATVLRMKHSAEERLSRAVGTLLGRQLADEFDSSEFDLIVPVPSHWTRRWIRGYNVAETLADSISRETGVPRCNNLLRALRKTAKQGTLSVGQRAKNVHSAFGLNPNFEVGKIRVLLVDDIFTTGSTLNEAARILRRAGIRHVDVAVVTRATGVS